MRHHLPKALAGIATLLAAAMPASAQSTVPATQPAAEENRYDRTLVVSPAFAEGPTAADPLAFTFTLAEQLPGDAAPAYLTAFRFASAPLSNLDNVEANNRAQEETIETIDPAATRDALGLDGLAFEFLEDAARRRRADWDISWREDGFETLLPNLNEARMLANLAEIRGKVHGAEGKFPKLHQDIRLLVTLGQHVGDEDEPFLVTGLVGAGIVRQGLNLAASASQLADAPNVYWPLATADVSFNLRAMFDLEREAMYATFPTLRAPDRFTERDFQDFLFRLDQFGTGLEREADDERAKAVAEAMLPRAKAWVEQSGHDVAGMGDYPIIATYLAGTYDAAWRELMREISLPYHLSLPRLTKLEQRWAAGRADELGPLGDATFPTTLRAVQSMARTEQQRNAIMLVEALRHHAATRGGLPATLDAIDLPLLNDPVTNEPFGYSVDGNTATIKGEGEYGFTWTVTLREPGPLPTLESIEFPPLNLPRDEAAQVAGQLSDLAGLIRGLPATGTVERLPKTFDELVEYKVVSQGGLNLRIDLPDDLRDRPFVLVTNGRTVQELYDTVQANGGDRVVYVYRTLANADRTQVLYADGSVGDIPAERLRELAQQQGFEMK